MSTFYQNTPIKRSQLGANIPKRHGKFAPKLASLFLKQTKWQVVGDIPNIPQAVLLAVPHTSNIDGVFTIAAVLALDIDIRLLGKKQLFAVPIVSHFLRWAGIIGIDRDKKGSVLTSTIARFKTGEPLFLGLAPEGARQFTTQWKTGFYYLAMEAGVPIIPVAMDYKSRQIRFMTPFYPTGDIDADLPKIYDYYQGVIPKHPDKLSLPLQRLNKPS